MLVVDTHVHVIASKANLNYPRAETAAQIDWVTGHAVELDALIPRLSSAGVEKAVLVQPVSCYAFDNSYAADSALRFPERFTSVGAFDYGADGAAEALTYWVRERGIRGARLRPTSNQRLDDARTLPVWQTCKDLGIPVVVQGITPNLYGQLIRVLDRFADVKIALDHLGGNPVDEGTQFAQAQPLFDLARYPNVYLKYTTTMFEACRAAKVVPHEFFGLLLEHYGAERLMWGSNYSANHEPQWPYEATINVAREMAAHFPEQQQAQILGEAALALWPELR